MSNERSSSGPRIASVTSPELLAVLEELKLREPIFHHPEFGTTRRDYEAMTDPDFWEVGASGRRYSREFVLDTLENRAPDPEESTWLTPPCMNRKITRLARGQLTGDGTADAVSPARARCPKPQAAVRRACRRVMGND